MIPAASLATTQGEALMAGVGRFSMVGLRNERLPHFAPLRLCVKLDSRRRVRPGSL